MDTTTRTLPMFPLGSVLLPHALLPLHVFEPRYRAMMRDLQDGDGRFGVVLIDAGHEVGGGERRSDLGTVAEVLRAEEFEDGRWGLVAVGTQRLRVLRWLPDDPYPVAEVELLDDPPADPDDEALRAATVTALRQVLALASELGDEVAPATTDPADDPLVASYHVATLAPIGPLDRQRLLAAATAADRLTAAASLLDQLREELELRLVQQDDDEELP